MDIVVSYINRDEAKLMLLEIPNVISFWNALYLKEMDLYLKVKDEDTMNIVMNKATKIKFDIDSIVNEGCYYIAIRRIIKNEYSFGN